MYHFKLIKIFYFGISVYAVISPTKNNFLSYLPGLILMWILYFIFSNQLTTKNLNIFPKKYELLKKSNNVFVGTVALSYLLFYPFYIKFYTGLSLFSAVQNVFSGNSNYLSYQLFFEDQKLNIFSLIKLPYIFFHGLLRFLFIAITIKTIAYKESSTWIEKMSIFIMATIIIIVGFARGTSFEFFELFLIFIFTVATSFWLKGRDILFSKKIIFKIVIIGFVLLSYLAYNIRVRMGDNLFYYSHPEFDSNSLIYQFSPSFALLIFSLQDYFLFGIQFSSIIIKELGFNSISGFISILFPNGLEIMGLGEDYRSYVAKFIDVGPRWNSDTMVFVERFGILILWLFIFYIGKYSRFLIKNLKNNLAISVLLFYCFYFMISLPIGNFISSSSANVISIIFGIIIIKYKKLTYFRTSDE